ncbi:hypothetical protein, partial [Serratia marcescens]|uniref:hypothetical protein n=1 Tax=Serratia marcescens TaxID=615 RepID=UPI001C37CEE8
RCVLDDGVCIDLDEFLGMRFKPLIEYKAFVPVETFEQFNEQRTIDPKRADCDLVDPMCLSRPLSPQ